MFQISSDLFWGFQSLIDLRSYTTLTDVVSDIKKDLKHFLMTRNLQVLSEKVDAMELHVHHPYSSLDDIRTKCPSYEIIYLCDHCRGQAPAPL